MQQRATFLGEVARSLYDRWGADISTLTILVPTRRARLFFCDELSSRLKSALWEPEWLTIDSLVEELTGLHTVDRLRLITELYKIYNSHLEETFDHFYHWGDLLLSDFDMIDKYRIDADMLFRNISDIKELESDLSYLSEEQRKIINSFWEGVLRDSADSKERRDFMRVWNSLGTIYHQFRERLLSLGIAYTGLAQRRAAELIESSEAELRGDRRYVVVGFNALSACEKSLFSALKRLGAEFYWDYDNSYLKDREQEAGMFLRENLSIFGEEHGSLTRDNMLQSKDIEVVSFPSNAAQCKYLPQLLNKFRAKDESGTPLPLDKSTAIILTDESLLLPTLFSLEGDKQQRQADGINVTMGFPIRRTMAYTLLERLLSLQSHIRTAHSERSFYHVDVTGLLSHPYLCDLESAKSTLKSIYENKQVSIPIALFSEDRVLSALFREAVSWQELSLYLRDVISLLLQEGMPLYGDKVQYAMLSVLSDEVSKLHNSILECKLDISPSIYISLLRKHLSQVKIPFTGEPLEGLQVMGILETRNLDFENVILLSMTDDNFPGKLDSTLSYIPYNLRIAYGLPTLEHHEGVYAYYFKRLLQRAKRVVLCYCSHADDKTTGEQSRYIRELEYEGIASHNLHFTDVGLDINLPKQRDIVVQKRGRVREALEEFLRTESAKSISPTAFARYIACPLKFYFASVAHLREKDDISDDVDNPMFGTILHGSMEQLYKPIIGVHSPIEELKSMLRKGHIESVVSDVINRDMLHLKSADESDYSGNILLVKDIVVRYIREAVIPYDIKNPNFTVLGLEKSVDFRFCFDDVRSVRFAGLADRVDRMGDGSLRVIDYKTGGVHLKFAGIDDLFTTNKRSLNANLMQTLLYSMILSKGEEVEAYPSLYYVREMSNKEFSPLLVDTQNPDCRVCYSLYGETFEDRLKDRLKELFDFDREFTQVSEREQDPICTYCDYKSICRR